MSSSAALLSDPTWARLAIALNTIGILGIIAYVAGQAHLVWLYYRRGPRPPHTLPAQGAELPRVAIQLPMYQECHVAATVIDACAALQWPADRLEIQVLDDSTDDTVAIVDARVAHWKRQGRNITVLRRPERVGYKAGALAHGASHTEAEFHAVFDADFVPPPDFLLRTMPAFADPNVGAIQARWGHLNRNWSWLTRAQALVIDAFFILEQEARHRAGLFIRFNGSAGLWRASALADAGGWQADTLSEDLDLAYRAQLAGWRMVYLRDVVAPAELPTTVNDYKTQQTRWARGRGQAIRKLLPLVWRARLPLSVKFHAVFDLLNVIVVPSLLLTAISSPFATVALVTHPELGAVSGAIGVVAKATNLVVIPIFIAHGMRPYFQGVSATVADVARTVPAFFALTAGINLVMFVAVTRGLRRGPAEFHRTSKYSVTAGRGAWTASRYRPGGIGPMVLAEATLAFFFVGCCAVDLTTGALSWLPFHLVLMAGFGLLAWLSMRRA